MRRIPDGRLKRTRSRRGAALYVTTMFTALLVSLLGMSGLALSRVEAIRIKLHREQVQAQFLARSALELAHLELNQHADWQKDPTLRSESKPRHVEKGSGTCSWFLGPGDPRFGIEEGRLTLTGVGRDGEAARFLSVQVRPKRVRFGTDEIQLSVIEFVEGTWVSSDAASLPDQ